MRVDTEGDDSLQAISFTIYKIGIPFIHQIFTGQLLCARHFARGLGTMVKKTDMVPALIYCWKEEKWASDDKCVENY